MTKHYLIFIHGIGEDKSVNESYDNLKERIRKEYKNNDFENKFEVIYVNWHSAQESNLSEAQTDIFETAFPEFVNRRRSARRFFTDFVGDVVAYVSEDVQVVRRIVWEQIWEKLKDKIEEEDCVYSFICHSLGTVIAFDYIFRLFNDNKLFIKDYQDQDLPIEKLKSQFRCFFTLGSPIGLFMLRNDRLWNQGKPFTTLVNPVKGDEREWINIYDIDDIVAYPLVKLFNRNPENADAKLADRNVQTGWMALDSHLNYWKDQEVAKLIADALSEQDK